ncbi:MAG TPA: glycine cleavage system protein GcvH [Gemmatimonadota bacterium]|jgi:glycine cleavage system H protein
MKFPQELRYTKEHEWVAFDAKSGAGTVGITDYAQGELGDIVFVELPAKGARIEAHKAFGTIEAVKAVSELFAPVTGEVVAVNGELESNPQLVNSEPYAGGWMIKIRLEKPDEIASLLSAAEYEKHVS